MISLCEECFPGWENHEVYTIVPITPCDECGKFDNRRGSKGLQVNSFPSDPRGWVRRGHNNKTPN